MYDDASYAGLIKYDMTRGEVRTAWEELLRPVMRMSAWKEVEQHSLKTSMFRLTFSKIAVHSIKNIAVFLHP